MSKRQYLELMGIDVWQKRLPRQAVQQVPEQPPVAAQAGGSGTALLADVRRSLKDGSNESKVPAPVAERPTPVSVADVSQEPAPEFYLTFSHFSGLTMVNVYPGGFAAIPGNHQRFLTTLYYALKGEKRNSELQEFRWPMLKSDRISQSRADAKQVLGRHLQQCQSDILVFGLDPADLLNAQHDAHYGEVIVRDRRLLIVEEAENYFREPVRRRQLWGFLGGLRQRLKGAP